MNRFVFLNRILLALSIFCSFLSYSQNDSLIRALDQTFDSRERVDILNQISINYYYINFDSLLLYANEAYKEALAASYTKGEILAIHRKCYYYLNIGDRQTAMDMLKQAELLAEKNGLKVLLARSYMLYGDIYSGAEIFDQAFNYYTLARDIFHERNELHFETMCLNRLGILYGKTKSTLEALEIFNQVLENADKLGSRRLMLSVFNNMAATYASQGEHEKSLELYLRALDSNMKYNNLNYIATNYSNIASRYKSLADTINAIFFYDKALALSRETGDIKQYHEALLNKGELLYFLKRYSEAELSLKEVFESASQLDWPALSASSAHILALLYEDMKRFDESVFYFKKYVDFQNIVESDGNTKKLTELRFKYDFEKEKLRLEAKHRQQNLFVYSFGIVSLLLIVLIFFLLLHFRTRAKKALLESKNVILEKDKLELEQENLSKKLELRNKEVISNIVLLQKKNEIISNIANTLIRVKSKISKDNRSVIEQCINELNNSTDDTAWQEFELHFNQVYESFFRKLDEINPDLTLNDRRLCAFLKMKMNTKEIAAITHATTRSIEVARYRLRKKLGIHDTSTNLSTFLEHL